jgi:alpha,alpha-trehalose phosphorylase
MQLAHDYLAEAALIDLDDLEHNVRDGVHMGSLAGAWLAVVGGLGGMRHNGDSLSFAPRLPPRINELSFRMSFLGRLLRVRIDRHRASYTLMRGRAITFLHHGEEVRLTPRRSEARSIPEMTTLEPPKQPKGRAPARRGVEKPKPLLPQGKPRSRLPRPKTTRGRAA